MSISFVSLCFKRLGIAIFKKHLLVSASKTLKRISIKYAGDAYSFQLGM